MIKAVLKKRVIYLFILIVVLFTLFALAGNKVWIEDHYTYGFYQPVARTLRLLFGWIPFSIGDIFYGVVLVGLMYKVLRNSYLLFRKKLTWHIFFRKLSTVFIIIFFGYGVFLVIWGLNYSRKGIAFQLHLAAPQYDTMQLLKLQDLMVSRVNETKALTDTSIHLSTREIFTKAVGAYHEAQKTFPFLDYSNQSIKSSLYGSWGNYFGFTGYYNPFTGEAQVNATVPKFLLPSITVHEMAHQVGYAKEMEANFVGFLVGSHSSDPAFRYSAYLDVLIYTNVQVRAFDTTVANAALKRLSPAVKADLREWKAFSLAHRSIFEPTARWIYGNFLKINDQPLGILSYDQVTSLVIAYYQKTGAL